MVREVLLISAGVYAAMSVSTLIMYGLDKRAAQRGKWRTPEKTLHTMALLGGWPGALIAQRMFRHKRRKPGFMGLTWLIVATHLAAWCAFGMWWAQQGR